MIDIETVFILGSGASKPFNFPTDADLRAKIVENFEGDYRDIPYTSDFNSRLIKFEKCKRTELAQDFVERLLETIGTTTLDECISVNEQYEEIGKIAIQFYLLDFENNYDMDRQSKYLSDWFELVLRAMLKDCKEQKDPSLFDLNKVHFLTFNYDRLVEYLFIKQFEGLFKEILSYSQNKYQIDFFLYKIIHLYGSLGRLPFKDETNTHTMVNFGEKIETFERIKDTLKNFHLMKDGFKDYDRISKKLYKAKRIYFLGVGYIEKNMNMLELNNNLNYDNPPQIYGTAFSKNEKEIDEIISKYFTFSRDIPKPIIEPVNCKELIRRYL